MVELELLDKLPRKVGIVAVNHFKENFRQSGFVDNGLKPWKRPLRQTEGKGAAAERPTLTSGRNHLMRSIQYTSRPGEVTILNPVEYAAIHNEGGTINTHPRITPKLRKFAWAKVYSIAGIQKKRGKKKTPLPKQLPPKARMWKAIALTKKARLNVRIKMPQVLLSFRMEKGAKQPKAQTNHS